MKANIRLALFSLTAVRLLALLRNVIAKLTGNALFPNPPVTLVDMKAKGDELQAAIENATDGSRASKAARNALVLEVRAMLRRSEDYHPTLLTWGDITLNPDTGVLSCGRESVRLSGREFQVIELFMRSPKVVLSADRIMERVWGWGSDAEINVVWVHISNLRKKIKSIGSGVTITAVSSGTLNEGGVQSKTVTIDVVDSSKAPEAA